MTVTRDLNGAGTPEAVWESAGLPDSLPEIDWSTVLAGVARVVLVSPHPDDEVLGAGGVLAELSARDVPVLLVAVTDGEASHAGRAEELKEIRALERAEALGLLGCAAEVVRLQQPDGRVDEDLLRQQLTDLVRPDDLLLVPWSRDGHPDHDACGRAAQGLPVSCWSYLVWAWHWAAPGDLPVDRARRVPLAVEQLSAKRKAVAAYVSQLEGETPILPPHVRIRLMRRSEVLLDGSA